MNNFDYIRFFFPLQEISLSKFSIICKFVKHTKQQKQSKKIKKSTVRFPVPTINGRKTICCKTENSEL